MILDAAIRILEREGLESLTTSRVAEVAGVSVGTLYQYFAHRDAIIDALQDRELERAGAMLERVLANPERNSDRDVARAVLEELLRLYRAAPALHRVLAVDGLRYSTPERVLAFDAKSVALVKAFLSYAGRASAAPASKQPPSSSTNRCAQPCSVTCSNHQPASATT